MENQLFKEEKTEENVNTSKKPHKELMEDKAWEEELEKSKESNTIMCGKEIRIKNSLKKMTKKITIQEFQGIETKNKTNTHRKLKGVIQTAYHTNKASKESSGKD